jgi:hypothetical protein
MSYLGNKCYSIQITLEIVHFESNRYSQYVLGTGSCKDFSLLFVSERRLGKFVDYLRRCYERYAVNFPWTSSSQVLVLLLIGRNEYVTVTFSSLFGSIHVAAWSVYLTTKFISYLSVNP